jgi:hypothetical protein
MSEATYMEPKIADAVYDALVEECGAPEGRRQDFVENFTAKIARTKNTSEYRFQGALGFGGKFYFEKRRWRVDCEPRDETPERIAMIERANVKLGIIREAEALVRGEK